MRGAIFFCVLVVAAAARAQPVAPEAGDGDAAEREPRAEADADPGARVDDGGLITERQAYDHRPPADATAEEALRWIPRALLAPLYGLTVLRREGIRTLLEPVGPPTSSPDAFEADEGPLGAMPVLLLENDRSPAAGLFVVLRPVDPLLVDATFQHWDDQRIEGWLRARVALSSEATSSATTSPATTLTLRGHGSSRGDRVFHGLGWASRQDARTRYRHHQGGARVGLRHRFFRSSAVSLRVRAVHHRFGASGFGGDPSLDEQADPDALPAGFAAGATVLEERFVWTIDSRHEPRVAPSEGVRLSMTAAHGADLESTATWLRAAADVAGTVELTPEHDLTLSGWAAAVEPLSAAPPPFVEQVTLGGRPGRLAGFLAGRLFGRSAAVVHARYRWALAPGVDAALHVEAGNVFGASFEALRPERARLSTGLSIDSLADDAHRIGMLVGFATAPFEQGADVTAGHVSFFLGSPPR